MKAEQGNQTRLIRRVNLQETRSSRAAVSIASAVVLLLVVLWLAVELVLSLTSNSALLMSPATLAQGMVDVATQTPPGALIAAGVLLALVGFALVALAVLPGTKPRHIMGSQRSAIVIDNEVVAAAVSRTARTVARLAPDQVTSSVGRKRIDVTVRPGSGRTVDLEVIKEAVEAEVAGYELSRRLNIGLQFSGQGAVKA